MADQKGYILVGSGIGTKDEASKRVYIWQHWVSPDDQVEQIVMELDEALLVARQIIEVYQEVNKHDLAKT